MLRNYILCAHQVQDPKPDSRVVEVRMFLKKNILFGDPNLGKHARRDKEQGIKIDPEETRRVALDTDENVLQVDQTDKQNRSFRYVL